MSPGALDRRVVRRHLTALRRAVRELERLRDGKDASPEISRQWSIERGLQLAAQNVLDVATHLVAARGRDVPDYTSALDEVGRLGIVPTEFATRIRGLAGFRNVLVHGYLETDPDVVRGVLEERLGDLERFARFVEDYLEASPPVEAL